MVKFISGVFCGMILTIIVMAFTSYVVFPEFTDVWLGTQGGHRVYKFTIGYKEGWPANTTSLTRDASNCLILTDDKTNAMILTHKIFDAIEKFRNPD